MLVWVLCEGFYTEVCDGLDIWETQFKVTANLLPTKSLLVQFEQNWTKGQDIIVQQGFNHKSMHWPWLKDLVKGHFTTICINYKLLVKSEQEQEWVKGKEITVPIS